jgi:hypothetical protein
VRDKNQLNVRQQKFADAILEGKTQRDAYLLAGYKISTENAVDVSASQLLSNPKIKSYIDSKRAKIDKKVEARLEISKEWALGKLKETVERCAQDIKPMLTRKGEPIIIEDKDGSLKEAYVFDSRGITAAIAEINKMQGYNAPTESKNTNINRNIDLSSVTPEQLMAAIEALQRQDGQNPVKPETILEAQNETKTPISN